MMPAKGSRWILFIPNAVPIDGMFETYMGADGRVEATEENLELVTKALELLKKNSSTTQ